MAKGYLYANITVIDAARYEEYRRAVPPIIERFGGRYLVRGGALDPVENGAGLDRLVVVEFDSLDAAKRFYHSDDYAPWLEIRIAATRSQVALVEGVA